MSRDPGLQPERTAKAWERTAIVMSVAALLVLRAGAHAGERELLICGGAVAASVSVIAALAVHRRRVLQGTPRPIGAQSAVSVTAAVFFAALAGAWVLGQQR